MEKLLDTPTVRILWNEKSPCWGKLIVVGRVPKKRVILTAKKIKERKFLLWDSILETALVEVSSQGMVLKKIKAGREVEVVPVVENGEFRPLPLLEERKKQRAIEELYHRDGWEFSL